MRTLFGTVPARPRPPADEPQLRLVHKRAYARKQGVCPHGGGLEVARVYGHGQICFALWPDLLRSMTKRSRAHAQIKVLASLRRCFGVKLRPSWRQVWQVLTPTRMAGHVGKWFGHRRIRGWPYEENGLATGQIAPSQASEGTLVRLGKVLPPCPKSSGCFPWATAVAVSVLTATQP